MYTPYQRPLVWNGPFGFDPSCIPRPQSASRPPGWPPVYTVPTVVPDPGVGDPSVQRLPAFNRHTDYVERDEDPSRPSDKKTLSVYRYRAAWDTDDNKHAGWKHIQLDSDEEPSKHMREHPRVKLVSWNIDFESNWPCDRATALVDYLQKDIFHCPETTSRPVPCVIMLQEVHSKALRDVFHKHDWIRNNFMLTPIDHDKWPLSWMHGCITLIERTVCVRDAYTINYAWSDQRRMAIGIEIALQGANKARRNMILLNTHLEDDIVEPVHHRHRKRQLNECRLQLIRKGFGGVLCASMSRFDGYDDLDDTYVYEKLGFVDAAGYDNDEKSNTWGYQGGRGAEKCRPDKMLVLSPPQRNRKLIVARPKRIGVGLTFKDNRFVSDHFGLCSTLEVQG